MPITPDDVVAELSKPAHQTNAQYTDRDTLLYAVAIGLGRDPLDEKELPYVCETYICENMESSVLPTAATVLARGARGTSELRNKMDYSLMLHGEQRLTVHQPLPPAGSLQLASRTTGVYDKGEGRGALVTSETKATLPTGEPLYTLGSTSFYRGDGGFGGSNEGAPEPHPLPDRSPDVSCEMPGRLDQALIYALCGDRNPLHRDPNSAAKSGFQRPILHGLCSYGIACHAVLKTMLDYDATRMRSFDVRFSSPVYPGETQLIDMWQDGDVVSFRVRVKERDVISINNGRCVIRP